MPGNPAFFSTSQNWQELLDDIKVFCLLGGGIDLINSELIVDFR